MCQLKSAIVLKDRIYMPDHDHHTQMLEELGIKDVSESPEFVRVELVPPNGDVFSNVDNWMLNVDQDFRPDWFFEELELPKLRECAKAWAKEHVFIGIEGLELPKGSTYYLKNCKNATLRGNSTATLRGNSTATLWDNSTATLWDNSTATLWENSTATLRGNSTATLRDNSTGVIPDCYYPAKRENFILMDGSTLKDCKTKTIYQSGEWKLVTVNV